ncbi:phage holin family protein [Bacillus sp. RG28]|uniref:Phage holin family protein n=1 Tax=Gottfriedia endophytica TaxID=2820819 RepID=A0A940NPT8_9BACI|nr:phage holin family protein [Gottfriedia endophytica]MBP0725520.1 phage holin family protein [Gottfriedia endophytica]
MGINLISLLPSLIQGEFILYFLFKLLDFITGLLKTWKGVSQYKSRVMRDGIIRWIGELVGIIFVLAIDLFLGLNFYLTGFTLGLFIYKEGGSIDENLKLIDVNLPGIIMDKLKIFVKGDNDTNE